MRSQARSGSELESRLIGGLPLVNSILDRLHVDALLEKALPDPDPKTKIHPARALGVLVRNIVLRDRRPLYTHAEWAGRSTASSMPIERRY